MMRTVGSKDRLERCRLGANEVLPFACPDGCLFFEARSTSSAGWQIVDPGSPSGEGRGPTP
jgi:hypothetical protein